ncbi:30S ribosomal protein S1 [bacterium]|nr:30S ribosomal protein S1 [bacterium]
MSSDKKTRKEETLKEAVSDKANDKMPDIRDSETVSVQLKEERESQNDMSYDYEAETEFDYDEMCSLYEETLVNIEEGEVVKGKVIKILENDVLVDVGYKSEGTIPIEEFQKQGKEMALKEGDVIDVFLENIEDSDGLVVLSKEKADKIKIWDDLNKAYENETVIKGKVVKRIKGGLTVDIGIPAFLPGSQIDTKPIRNLDLMINEDIKVKIIKLNRKRGNIVVSRRSILEEERESKRIETIKNIAEGNLVKGIVKNITEYGVFIDLGGIDGLLHITDMSWGRIRHPSELFMIGDEVEVKVLKFDPETEKVSLGLKQKTVDPWEKADERYVIGNRIRAKVVSLTDYGAFVELEEGVEGLIHVSEMSWTKKIRHPSRVVAIGDVVEVIVLDVDKERKRISLGMKQTEPNPWLIIENKYKIGSKITGRVRNLTDFGAFVELEEGVDGLIHISDMSWTQRVKHPSDVIKKGERIEAVILNIDSKNERLSMGIKQLTPDPWLSVPEKYPIGSNCKCKVVKLIENGAIVELEEGIDGYIHISEISEEDINSPKDVLKEGDFIRAKIIRLDPENRKIGLSIRAHNKEQSDLELSNYNKKGEMLNTLDSAPLKEIIEAHAKAKQPIISVDEDLTVGEESHETESSGSDDISDSDDVKD